MKQQYKMVIALVTILFVMSLTAPFQVFGAKIQESNIPTAPPKVYLPLLINSSPPNGIFGITFGTYDDAHGLSMLASAGYTSTRIGISWPGIEPSEGARNWDANLESSIKNFSSHNIQIIGLVNGTPGWAQKSGITCAQQGTVNSAKFTSLGNFLYDLVKRYSAPPYNVHIWELWNEEDAAGVMGCWGDTTDTKYFGGAYYGSMLKSVYGRIKAADQQSLVLVGGLLMDCDGRITSGGCSPNNPYGMMASHFLEGILASGDGNYFDGVSFHGYDYYSTTSSIYFNPNWASAWNVSGPVNVLKGRYLKSLLTQYGFSNKSLYNTELAIFYGANVQDPPCNVNPLPANFGLVKSAYVVQSFAATIGEGWKSGNWFSSIGVRCSGLLNPDTTPQPAYYAYQYTYQRLNGAAPVRVVNEFPNILGYAYTNLGHSLWLIWTKDAQNHQITLPQMPTALNQIGSDGKPVTLPLTQSITVSMAPLFVTY